MNLQDMLNFTIHQAFEQNQLKFLSIQDENQDALFLNSTQVAQLGHSCQYFHFMFQANFNDTWFQTVENSPMVRLLKVTHPIRIQDIKLLINEKPEIAIDTIEAIRMFQVFSFLQANTHQVANFILHCFNPNQSVRMFLGLLLDQKDYSRLARLMIRKMGIRLDKLERRLSYKYPQGHKVPRKKLIEAMYSIVKLSNKYCPESTRSTD